MGVIHVAKKVNSQGVKLNHRSPNEGELLDEGIIAKQRDASLELLVLDTSPAVAVGLAEDTAARAEALVRKLERRERKPIPLACHSGCDYCCHNKVELSAPEVLRILEFIAAEFNDEERQVLAERVRGLDEASRGLTWQQREVLRRPCPLLVAGRCSVYEVRPLACRGWTSLDASACKQAFENPGTTVYFVGDIAKITNSIWLGLSQALHLSALKGERLELVAALHIGLDATNARGRWLRGEAVFQAAETV